MQVLSTKRREGSCTEMYLRGLKNRNGEHIINICESSIFENHS